MDMDLIIILTTITIFSLAIIILLSRISKRYFSFKELDSYYNEKVKSIEVFSDITSINESIDTYINMIYDDYKAMHIDKFNDYISPKLQDEIIRDVQMVVLKKVSYDFFRYLKFIYNEDEIVNVLKDRATLIVIFDIIDINNNNFADN